MVKKGKIKAGGSVLGKKEESNWKRIQEYAHALSQPGKVKTMQPLTKKTTVKKRVKLEKKKIVKKPQLPLPKKKEVKKVKKGIHNTLTKKSNSRKDLKKQTFVPDARMHTKTSQVEKKVIEKKKGASLEKKRESLERTIEPERNPEKKSLIVRTHPPMTTQQGKRVPTGIKNFDPLIEGGLERYSINLLVGGSGSGKTIFAMQFLMEGLKKGEACLYITFEEQKEQFYLNMKEFGWDLEYYEKKGLFMFLEYSPIKVKTMLEEGGGAIESIILGKKISRLVIDSLTSFALLFEDELRRREAALDLFGMIHDWKCTSLLTFEEESIQRSGRTASEALESDSIIMLYARQINGVRTHFLEVVKMRGTKHSTNVFPYEIGNGGVVLDKNPVTKPFS